MDRERWYLRDPFTLAGALLVAGPLLVLIALAAMGEAPVFAAVLVAGLALVALGRRRLRR
jgi:hypothetical protein